MQEKSIPALGSLLADIEKRMSMYYNVLEYLEDACEKFPEKVLVGDVDKEFTYRKFQKIARSIGTEIAKKEIYKEPIAILIDKDSYSLAAFMGAVYAGCFYVPIDKELPAERIKKILSVVCPRLLLVQKKDMGLPSLLNLEVERAVIEEIAGKKTDMGRLETIRKRHIDTDPLYIMFTSGSTGTPKGVVISHRSVIDLMEQFHKVFSFAGSDVFGNQAPFDFDVSVKDWYLTLKCGGTMQMIPKSMFVMPKKLVPYLNQKKVSIVIWAASALGIVESFKAFQQETPMYLRKVMFSGEVLPVRVLHYWQKYLKDTDFVNLYGPTEITCNCTYYIVDREFTLKETLPIGRAFPNTEILLLDRAGRKTGKGEIGEICVRGSSLALGYYNAGEISKTVFCQNPAHNRYRDDIYRTGDLGYYNRPGELVFASRKDSQIKHMGHRIELGEIEAAANSIKEMISCCCLYDKKKGKIILIYQAGKDMGKEFAGKMQKKLPKYMCPNRFIYLKRMPMNSHDKIDRARLRKEYIEMAGMMSL